MTNVKKINGSPLTRIKGGNASDSDIHGNVNTSELKHGSNATAKFETIIGRRRGSKTSIKDKTINTRGQSTESQERSGGSA